MSAQRAETEIDGRQLTLSNPGKVLYPGAGFTKADALGYYRQIAGVMLPHVRYRPVTFRRFPDGVGGKSFIEKHVPAHAPDWITTMLVPLADSGGEVEYPVMADRPALVWAANLAALELHVPLWHARGRGRVPGRPDHQVYDLDPGPGTTLADCCRVALWIARLSAAGRAPVAKTSGSKGLQVYAPLPARTGWDRATERAHELARAVEAEHRELVVTNMRKDLRRGRVLIDWSQNSPAKTTIAVYSLRGVPEPSVSAPVTWDEVTECADSGDPARLRFGPAEVLRRAEAHGDLFAAMGL